MKKIFLSAVVFTMLLLGVTAYAESVNVVIAPFKTEIQYVDVDNRYVEYPLIVYKDITYFPMTYDLCTSLGLMVGYSSEDGLYITSQATDYYNAEPKPYGNSALNAYETFYSATIPNYPIYLNGVRIYNDKEEYPILNFRNVTYFPMTYRFAYEELGFDIKWSNEERFFRLRYRGGSDSPYPTIASERGVEFIEQVSVYEPHYDENGEENGGTLLYEYYRSFLFDYLNKELTNTEYTDETETDGKLYDIEAPTPSVEMTTEIKNNAVYADGILLKQFANDDADKNVTNVAAYKTDIGNNTFIVRLRTQVGDFPAPYTQRRSYVFEVKDTKVRELDFDKLYNLNGIYDMGDKVYVAANGYRAVGSSRWSNSFSDVFVYDKNDGTFISLVEQNKDKFNSIGFLGYTDGKLYVKAMWYDGDKSKASMGGIPTFSTVNGGFYSADVTDDDKLTKLYPYIKGETFVFPDGNLYCVADYSQRAILVNLCTGEMYKFN